VSNKYGKPRLRKEVIESAVVAYLLGEPLKEIAARFDISMQSVINHAAKAGFKLRKKRRRP
jgi:transposase-like protein